MKSIYQHILIIISLLFSTLQYAQVDTFNKQVDDLQRNHVKNGRVDYTAIAAHPALLKNIQNSFDQVDLEKVPKTDQMAFYINAYNFMVIKKTIEHYPLQSVMDVEGFFKNKYLTFQGNHLSLNEYERMIFEKFPDEPRLHFVLVCAAQGCPDLSDRAFTGNNINTKLKTRTRAALRDEKMVRLDLKEKKVYVSKIFNWYFADFTKDKTLREFINYYRNDDIPADFEIVYMEYNWALNDTAQL